MYIKPLALVTMTMASGSQLNIIEVHFVIESTQGAIWDVPFPAVTICDLNMISRSGALSFANNLTLPQNMTAEYILQTLRLAPLLHSPISSDDQTKKHLSNLQDVLDLNEITVETLFRNLSPTLSCNNLVQRCMWKNTIYRCEQLFQQIFTVNTLCCTFNYYAIDFSLMSKNFELLQTSSPRRVASCGYQTALTVLLHSNPEDYYSTVSASRGILVYIDDAYNIPDFDSPVRIVNPFSEVLIALSPERTYSTPGVKSFSPDQRQCYYNDEVKIGSFNQYSFHNCLALKKVELTRKLCDCVPFYFPVKDKVEENTDEFQCLPECEHFDYPLEVALGKLSSNTPLSGLPFFENVDLKNRSVVNVFFNDLVSTRYRRDVYLNWQNILAAFGGLLSLMLGFTLISGFDFIIFFTFQVTLELLRRDRTKNAGKNSKDIKAYVIKVGEKHWKNQKMYTEEGIEKWRSTNVRY
ncbi:sodium channel protein Nach-like [Leptidea sinapis]|uniref:sodium channel protein Nach-like n=1 Tax=Leptidea sinapis TaxID=189913 RepID=UPI0021C3B511|nr:sodium channel protein Nach-like [Leptidea sinapis]